MATIRAEIGLEAGAALAAQAATIPRYLMAALGAAPSRTQTAIDGGEAI